jgi:hypothetical protein
MAAPRASRTDVAYRFLVGEVLRGRWEPGASVKSHVNSVMHRLGARNLTHAVSQYLTRSQDDPPERPS